MFIISLNWEEHGHICKRFAKFYHKYVNAEWLSMKSRFKRTFQTVHTIATENLMITDLYLIMKEDTFPNIAII